MLGKKSNDRLYSRFFRRRQEEWIFGRFPLVRQGGRVFFPRTRGKTRKSMEGRRGQAALSGSGVAGGGAVMLLMNVSSVLEKPLIIDMMTAAR